MVSSTRKLAIVLVFIAFIALVVAVVPKASAGWSTTDPGINYWIDPNIVDNAHHVIYAGDSILVSSVQYGWNGGDKTTYFYVHIKNDNYANNANLALAVSWIQFGPFPSTDWQTNGWLGWAVWDNVNNVWSAAESGYNSWMQWLRDDDYKNGSVKISDLDSGESVIVRLAFNFTNTAYHSAGSWFPGAPDLYLTLFNFDNDEVYWTPELKWWVWDSAYENTVNYAVADTYVASASATTNYGSVASMLSFQGPPSAFIYMKFSLTLPANWGVQSAVLRYYVNVDGGSANTRRLYSTIETDWLENGVTWNTALTDADFLSDACPHAIGWNTVDVSSYIRARVASGATMVSFDYHNQYTIADNIRTKEYGDGSYAPRLIIESASMGAVVPPTFDVVFGTAVTDWSGDYANILLRGRVDNMGNDASANFMFMVDSTQWDTYETYTYPTAVTSTGFFSLTTTGYQFHRGSMYGVRLQCHGNSTQTNTWMPATGYYMFIVENTIQPPSPIGHLPCTLTTTDVKGVTESGATVYFSFTVGANNSLFVYLDIGENADNLDNYTSVSYGSYTWSETGYSWASSYAFSGLENGRTYYVRARGIDAGFVIVNGGWMTFTTLTTTPSPSPVIPPIIDITTWPDALAKRFNMTRTGAGILLSAIFALMFLFPVMYLGGSSDNLFVLVMATLVVTFSITSYAFVWSPGWLPISMVIFFIFAGTLGKVFRG